MFSGLIVVYITALLLLYLHGKSLWKPLYFLFGVLFQGALGAAGIYLFNLLAQYFTLEIPLNPFNSLFVGFLGIPGLLVLLVARYLIKL
ncbi:MAG TPA: pro-sigmaK processing inhibitor BofA family protein [Bacillota bacterium]|nr:pro-sigmaK processing inhibitor BofA family protein [Bacillota bacterium]